MNALLLSGAASFFIGVFFVFTSGAGLPWWLVALFWINSTLAFQPGVRWLQGRLDTFDPVGLLGLYAPIYYLLSPAYQVAHDFWPFIPPLTYDHDWIALWALLNTVGIAVYLAILAPRLPRHRRGRMLLIEPNRFWPVMAIALTFCFFMQVYVFMKFGGIGGFVHAFTERQEEGLGLSRNDPLDDLGLPLIFAESFKYLFAMSVVYWGKTKAFAKTWGFFFGFMAICLVVFLVFGGLRGSRSSTLFSLVFAAAMYHYWVRQLRVRTVILGVAFCLIFTNTYYWYKIAGTSGLAALVHPELRKNFNSARQDPTQYVITRDLGRMDVQTLAMREFAHNHLKFDYGATYATSIFTVIPTKIIPVKPTYLLKTKTEIVRGVGRFVEDTPRTTTVVLGLFGEGFINFGYAGILLAFTALAFCVRSIRGWIYDLAPDDARRLLLPAFCLLPYDLLITDLGVVVMIIARSLLVPLLVLMLATKWRASPLADRRSEGGPRRVGTI